MAKLISGKVKSSKLTDTFIKLEEVEPSLGIPTDSNSIAVSDIDGNREFYSFDSGFSYNESTKKAKVDLSVFSIEELGNVKESDGSGNVIDGGKFLIYSIAQGGFVPTATGASLDSSDAVTFNGLGPSFYLDARNHNFNQFVFDSTFEVRAARDSTTFSGNVFRVFNQSTFDAVTVQDSLNATGPITSNARIYAQGAKIQALELDIESDGLISNNLTVNGIISGDGSGLTNVTADSAVFADLAEDLESAAFNSLFSDKSTTDLTEGTNLYYTQSRADSAIDARLATNGANLNDNVKLTFGDDSDLKIQWTGTVGSFEANAFQIKNTAGNSLISADSNSPALLYNGSEKLTVLDSGVAVTGNLSATNMSLTGNLTITGTTTTVNSTTLSVADPIIHLGVGNESSDVVDIGFFGHYSPDAGVTREHTGFFRDANNGQYYLFAKYQATELDSDPPTNVVDRTDSTFGLAALNVLELVGDSATFSGKIKYSNMYSTEGDLPSATEYHGMFAHVHATGKGYFAHGGNWIKLLDETSSTTDNLSEGSTNQYFTTARARASLGVASTTGFGGLAYDSTTGIYTLDKVDSADILTVYSAGNNITISPAGVITASGAPQADNAALLDSISSESFLRSDVDDVVDSGVQLTFRGSAKLAFGDSTGPAYFQYQDATNRVRWVGGIVDNFNADMIDSIEGSSILRSDVTDIKTAGALIFNDNIELILGTDSDLVMYHNGAAAVIRNNTGDYHIQTEGFLVKNSTGTETMIDAEPNSYVRLYYDNATKLTTQTNGVKVTGTLEVSDTIEFSSGAYTIVSQPTSQAITSDAVTVVDTYTTADPAAVRYDVKITDTSTTPDQTQYSTVMIAFNGESDVGFTEYGVVHTGDSDMGFLTADVVGSGQVRLKFERRAGRGTMDLKASRTIVK